MIHDTERRTTKNPAVVAQGCRAQMFTTCGAFNDSRVFWGSLYPEESLLPLLEELLVEPEELDEPDEPLPVVPTFSLLSDDELLLDSLLSPVFEESVESLPSLLPFSDGDFGRP